MTEADQREIASKLLYDYQDLKKTLACMMCKAGLLADQLDAISKTLTNPPDFSAPPKHNPTLIPKHPDRKECFEIISAIWETQQKIDRMNEDLTAMGIQFPIE